MPRLPMDPSQWGALIMRGLIQQFPALEPHIQLVKIEDQDPEGNAYGIIPLSNGTGFIPFVVREFELKPLDTLIAIENGEERFRNLSEANAILAVGGIHMGKPVSRNPVGLSVDQELNMLPPRSNMFGHRLPAMNVMQSIQPVKLAAEGRIAIGAVETFLKEAAQVDPDLPRFIAQEYQDVLLGLVDLAKTAAARATLVVLDPRGAGVDVLKDGEKGASISLQEAADALRGKGIPDANVKIATLMRGEPVVFDLRGEKRAGLWTTKDPQTASGPHSNEPGWVQRDGQTLLLYRTRYLDGKPTSFMLALAPSGYLFGRYVGGKPVDPPNSAQKPAFFRPAELAPGELCFLVDEKTQESSVPFRIKSRTNLEGGACRLEVSPLLGQHPTMTIHFGNNRNPYPLGRGDEIALPKTGYAAYKLTPKKLDDWTHSDGTVKVRLFKGGGVFSVSEDKRPPMHGLTRGPVVAMLLPRYDLDPDTALAYVQQAGTYITPEFEVSFKEEPRNADPQGPVKAMACKMACLLWDFIKKAGERDAPGSGTAPVVLGPSRSGPNREESPPGPSGPNPVAGGGIDQGAGIMPDIPFMREVTSTITGFATGSFTPDELSDIYNSLVDKLMDVQDLTGRVLTLARLGKIDFITEAEAKRLLDESDKFRSALLNADMLLKGITSVV